MTGNSMGRNILWGMLGIVAIAVYLTATSALATLFWGRSMESMQPWAIYYYWQTPGNDSQARKLLIFAHAIPVAMIFLIVGPIMAGRDQKYIHGRARWAKEGDIKKANLRAKEGLLLGMHSGQFLRFGGNGHVLLAAPTESGKGVGVVVPNMLTWKGSAICSDIRGENYNLTAGFREAHGQKVYNFCPGRYETHCYNPLDFINDDPNLAIADLQKMGMLLWPPNPKDPVWNDESRNLFLGITLYLRATGATFTIGAVYRFANRDDHMPDFINKHLAVYGHLLNDTCVAALGHFANIPDKQAGSILSTLTSRLSLWANPLIDACTSRSDFNLLDLRRRRMSIYIGINPSEFLLVEPLMTLFFQQMIDLNMQSEPDPEVDKYMVMAMFDEFTNLGKLPVLAKAISFIRTYMFRFVIVIQGPSQIEGLYGKEGARDLLQNSKARLFFASNDRQHAEDVAKELGAFTVAVSSRSTGGGKTNKTISKQKKELMNAQEVMTNDPESAVLLMEASLPVECKKIRYYMIKELNKRIIAAPNTPSVEPYVRPQGDEFYIELPPPDADADTGEDEEEEEEPTDGWEDSKSEW